MALDNLTPDKDQQIIINMSAERTAIVKGIAGSGKSLTLLKKGQASFNANEFLCNYSIYKIIKTIFC